MAEPSATRNSTWALSALLAGVFCIVALVLPSRWLLKPQRSVRALPELRETTVALEPSAEQPADSLPQADAVESEPAQPEPPLLSTDSMPRQEPLATASRPRVTGVARTPSNEREVPRSEVQRVAGLRAADAGAWRSRSPAATFDAGAEPAAAARAGDLALAPMDPELEPPAAERPAAVEQCGLVSCAAGFSCCNPSCGTCVVPGESCDQTLCESKVQYPVSVMCGRNTCSVGEVCCNASCGTCVAPGESCSQELCN